MRTSTFCSGLIVLLFVPAVALSQSVNLSGKTQSKVTAHVTKRDTLTVTDDKGGWFERGLEMRQLGGWTMPYEVQARLKVVSTSGVFQVRMDEPLTIRNQSNAAQVFRSPKVNLGNEGGEPKALLVGQSTSFQNPAPPVAGTDSVGYYNLAISAYPPEGDFKSTVGTYTGVLSMTFEPVVKAP
ncbi:hypothetical protein WI61_26395 [Burkholderia cepacia]|uniref:hypothetical protein n=1 Tax=Burkholderia cepacia TaxID=292 RepID=UPI000755C72A|nr:hypothetical protein [Burkholderia cepacia]KVA53385.1 hypothetical protein WI47_12225 [Burkholderia cepacia]KVA59015.1 hypothetical protein WI48_16815 [Burkholderia cepacia]KVA63617.1 hypothetical protein WI49_20155 [Burkholderia cepacia]KVA86008.1 hypothetical protein WI50_16000 [Burkholderia cepacia]KVA88492.1 hypothetical protein WI52_10545 [Burkholderia cepacia]